MKKKIMLMFTILILLFGLTSCSKNIANEFNITDYYNKVSKEKFLNEFNIINDYDYSQDFEFEYGYQCENEDEIFKSDIPYEKYIEQIFSTRKTSVDYKEARIKDIYNYKQERKLDNKFADSISTTTEEYDYSFQEDNNEYCWFDNKNKIKYDVVSFSYIIRSLVISLPDDILDKSEDFYVDKNIYTFIYNDSIIDEMYEKENKTIYQYIFNDDSIIFIQNEIEKRKSINSLYSTITNSTSTKVSKISFKDVNVKAINPDKYEKLDR